MPEKQQQKINKTTLPHKYFHSSSTHPPSFSSDEENNNNNHHNNKNFDENMVMQTCFSCERVLWLVLILGLITMASIQIRQRLKSYLDHDTIVQITDHHEVDIDFPAITLCNFNRIYVAEKFLK